MNTKPKKDWLSKSMPPLMTGLSLAIIMGLAMADNAVSITAGNDPTLTSQQPTTVEVTAIAIANTNSHVARNLRVGVPPGDM